MLFAEIALIRWLSTEARIFAYVNNLVLLSCFLGIGLGCYYSRRKVRMWVTSAGIAGLVLIIKLPLIIEIQGQELHVFRDVPLLLSAFTDSVIWYESGSGTGIWLTALGMLSTLVIFVAVLVSFVPLGQMLGRLLDDHKNTIVAYSINVAASVAGIWCFGAFSIVYSPPWIWFAFTAMLLAALCLFYTDRSRANIGLIVVLTAAVAFMALSPVEDEGKLETVWSPYQKLELHPLVLPQHGIDRGYLLNVNNVGYMSLLDLSDDFVRKYPHVFSLEERQLSQYDIPYRFKKDARRALIFGAGAGNDAAGALRNNVGVVDAVEIDPGIHNIGSEYHPERPYSDSRVNVIIDDARSYLKRTEQLYDVISFGLLDAHTHSSAYNNTRIDHYVYTLESFCEARERLREDGILTVAFEAQRPWIKQRLHDLLEAAFGHKPLVFTYPHSKYGWGGSVFAIGRDSATIPAALAADPALAQFTSSLRRPLPSSTPGTEPIKLTDDDWPYLYLEGPGIPNMHWCLMIILAVLLVAARKLVLGKGPRLDLHFFFLGAAFLLLEFQNISKASLLFGSTWLVNSFIITGILILILLANLFVSFFKARNSRLVYSLLIISCLIVYAVPLSWFNFLGYWEKAFVVSVVLNLPIFFGGIIFIESFRRTPSKDLAFGSNLLGAVVGGILESVSFVIGINALLLLVVVFYALSWWTAQRSTAIA